MSRIWKAEQEAHLHFHSCHFFTELYITVITLSALVLLLVKSVSGLL